jgi:hypothetical protein
VEQVVVRNCERGKTGRADVDPQIHAEPGRQLVQMTGASNEVTQSRRALPPSTAGFVDLHDPLSGHRSAASPLVGPVANVRWPGVAGEGR